jgi:hypothetical protein
MKVHELKQPARQAEEFSQPGKRNPGVGDEMNSSACYARSLKVLALKSYLPTLVLLLLAFALEGCSHGIHSGTGGWPPAAAASPARVSSSADVVKARAASVDIRAGGNADATVTLSISTGFHINANPASFPYLIATELQPGKLEGITTDKPAYPPATKKEFQFAEQPLAVYEGEAAIKLPLRASVNAKKGDQSLPIRVRVQACDNEKCYAPATLEGLIPVSVN